MSLLNEYTLLNDQLIMYFDFQGDSASRVNDKSQSGKNDGIIVNQAQLEDLTPENRVLTFNHAGDYVRVANSTEINGRVLPKYTISLAFQVEDPNISDRKQVLYEQGGRGAGLNIYIHAGRLYVGGWNNARWQATFLSTDQITAGKWHHVTLVLDATPGSTSLQAGALRGYLDGAQFGAGQGLELGAHLGGIGLGNVNIDTRFHDGTFQGTGNHSFGGSVDEVLLHNRALQSSEIAELAGSIPKTDALGTNLFTIADWSTQVPFLDGFKSSRSWIPQNSTTWDTQEYSSLDLDANGWVKSLPASDAAAKYDYVSTLLYREIQGQYPGGQYVVSYDGQGKLNYGMDATLVQSTPGRDVIQVNPSNRGILLSLRETDPQQTGDYLRNIQVIPAAQENNAANNNIFNPTFLEKTSRYQSLRFMDWMQTNDSTQKEWADRPTLETASWSKSGAPVEVMVALANALDADPWFNIPHQATDEYITKFAQYVQQHLEPELKVYVEYSNEVWNPQFQQYHWVAAQAKLTPQETTGVTEWYSRRTTQVTQIWDQVFAADKERVIGVMATQAGNPWIASRELSYPWTTQPLSHAEYGIDALAIAPYFGGNDYLLNTPEKVARVSAWAQDSQGGLDAFFDELLNGAYSGQNAVEFTAATINTHQQIASDHNLQLLAYEGGQHFTNTNNPSMTDLFIRANRDPRMGQLYEQYLEQWEQLGGGLFQHFSDVATPSKWGSWGALESIYQETSPKFEALKQFIA